MKRRIVTKQEKNNLESYPEEGRVDGYFDKLIKYIPTEIVGAWIAITGLIKSSSDVPAETILWVLFIVFIGLTVVYIGKQTAERNKPPATMQIAISTGAFIVWVFALGEPFSYLAFYRSVYGSLVLVLYNLIIPLIDPKS
ncbi:MAG: hypothetical protein SXA11_14870 [Cyanobacteriota bacterium]|nr:hypothetical protein [Cyanobacteriota bacterium]